MYALRIFSITLCVRVPLKVGVGFGIYNTNNKHVVLTVKYNLLRSRAHLWPIDLYIYCHLVQSYQQQACDRTILNTPIELKCYTDTHTHNRIDSG